VIMIRSRGLVWVDRRSFVILLICFGSIRQVGQFLGFARLNVNFYF
jgi:hypothetical protein